MKHGFKRETSAAGVRICTLWIVIGCATCVLSAEPGQFEWMGRASCASNTCHGGVVGRGPRWSSSLREWEAKDVSHAIAGQSLLQTESRAMVARLSGVPQETLTDDLLHSVLHSRCVACHAPSASSLPMGVSDQWRRHLLAGVDCEACHGRASGWIDQHRAADWNADSHRARRLGMIATENWETRTRLCADCHLGSRREGAEVREVNHDLLAAGHPPLHFDMSRFQHALPNHWQRSPHNATSTESRAGDLATLQQHFQAQDIVRRQALELARSRILESQSDPHLVTPEFSEYRCLDCHHSFLPPTGGFSRESGWQRWYFADVVGSGLVAASSLPTPQSTPPEIEQRLLHLEQRLPMATPRSTATSSQRLARLLASPLSAGRWDAPQAHDHSWYLRLLIYHAQKELADDQYLQLLSILNSFDEMWLDSIPGDAIDKFSREIPREHLLELHARLGQVLDQRARVESP